MPRLRILTWHVHGNYLWYLSHVPHDIFLPVKPGRPPGYGGRGATFPWPDNVHEVAAEDVADLDLDCVVTQSRENWVRDREEILSPAQMALPTVHVEHDPPRDSPMDTRHPVDDPDVLLVHVTAFNDLMWDSGRTPTRVIEHGSSCPKGCGTPASSTAGSSWSTACIAVAVGWAPTSSSGPAGTSPSIWSGCTPTSPGGWVRCRPRVAAFIARYRFFFHPIRYTSLGLAACEAMMLGMPVVALATTEMSTVVENGVSGWIDTDVDRLVDHMKRLLSDGDEARQLGEGARRTALERFSIDRFVADWDDAFRLVTGEGRRTVQAPQPSTVSSRR